MATSGRTPESAFESTVEGQVEKLSVRRAAAEEPHRVALLTPTVAWTFAQLWRRVRAEMALLVGSGVTGRRPLAVVGRNEVSTLVRIYAALELGLPVALLHDRATTQERRQWIDHWDAQGVPSPGGGDGSAEESVVERRGSEGQGTMTNWPPPKGDGILGIFRTSGTAGKPKGVCLSRRAMVASAVASAANLGWQDDDRWLLALPLAHVGGFSILLRCLLGRRCLVLPARSPKGTEHSEAGRFDGVAVGQLLEELQVTLLSVVPTMLDALLRSATAAPSRLRAVLVGGAAAPPQLMQRAVEQGWPVLATYGCSETASQITTQPYGTGWSPAVGCGRPLAGQRLRLSGDGRIEVRGPTLMDGYLPPGDEPFTDDGWLRTGDLGHLDDDGNLHVSGRADDVIISGGENVTPLTVEAVLASHPAVAAACVFGRPDAKWGQRVVAALVVRAGAARPSQEAWETFLRQRLAPYERPKEIFWLEALPLNAVGKVDRRATATAVSAPGVSTALGEPTAESSFKSGRD